MKNLFPEATDFFKYLYWDNEKRIIDKRDLSKDIINYKNNIELRKFELELIEKNYNDSFPIIFIIGAPRSGTTLLSQLLANNLNIGYPNNFTSKYFMAPIYGYELQKEKVIDDTKIKFKSSLGNTSGVNSPHEYGYFWHLWFNHKEHDYLTNNELDKINWTDLKKQLFALSGYFRKPFVFKNINYTDYKILRLKKELKNVKFINIERELPYVIQSCYQARLKRYSDPNAWFGVRPACYKQLCGDSWENQIYYQVNHIKESINNDSKYLDGNLMNITYEELTNNTSQVLNDIAEFLGIKFSLNKDFKDVVSSNNIKVEAKVFERILYVCNQ